MKLHLFLIACVLAVGGNAQVVLHINAGSRAAWGNYQNLIINNDGTCRFHLIAVNGPVLDSTNFSLTNSELQSILDKAEQVRFYRLRNKYDGGYADGAGILISISSIKKHSVHLLNTDVPQVNEFVSFLNSILAPRNIRIYYGQPFLNK